MLGENVEELEYLRYIIIKKKREVSQSRTYSESALKEKGEQLEALDVIDFILLEQLRKILS